MTLPRVLELQATKFGNYCPAHIIVEIDDVKGHIRDINQKLIGYLTNSDHDARKGADQAASVDIQLKKKGGENATSSRDEFLDLDYGIKIISPKDGEVVGKLIEVLGVFSVMPSPERLRLFTVCPSKTRYGERYWPHEVVKDFSSETNIWRTKVNIQNDPSDTEWGIIAAIVGQSTIALWNFYYKVGPTIGWWDFEDWPKDDTKICHRIRVLRV
jgi:hypothetical protein